jgi:hypothetical protein
MGQLFIGLIAGVFGMAYLVYGKRRTKFSAMMCGLALCVYPYMIENLVWLCIIGVVLLIVPFVTDY